MRAFKCPKTSTETTVKKVLMNRSRSGINQFSGRGQEKFNVKSSPLRNTIGLLKFEDKQKVEGQKSGAYLPNSDYYQKAFLKQESRKGKGQKPGKSGLLNENKKQEISNDKTKQSLKKEETQDNTLQHSRATQEVGKKNSAESEYFFHGYINPTIKLKRLESQKCLVHRRAIQNLSKVMKTQEQIQQRRSNFKLESQIYMQIIENLRRESREGKSTISIDSNIRSILKNSGTTQTQQGESSNQY